MLTNLCQKNLFLAKKVHNNASEIADFVIGKGNQNVVTKGYLHALLFDVKFAFIKDK